MNKKEYVIRGICETNVTLKKLAEGRVQITHWVYERDLEEKSFTWSPDFTLTLDSEEIKEIYKLSKVEKKEQKKRKPKFSIGDIVYLNNDSNARHPMIVEDVDKSQYTPYGINYRCMWFLLNGSIDSGRFKEEMLWGDEC